jgi:nucleoside phosphorylase
MTEVYGRWKPTPTTGAYEEIARCQPNVEASKSTRSAGTSNQHRLAFEARYRAVTHANKLRSKKKQSSAAPFQPLSSTPLTSEYTIGWVSTLPLDDRAARTMLDKLYLVIHHNSPETLWFTFGRVGSHNVVMTYPGSHGVSSAVREMRDIFSSIKFVFMVGTGGGVPGGRDDIRLGDVVVSQPDGKHRGVVQHDLENTEDESSRSTGHPNPLSGLNLSVLDQIRDEVNQGAHPDHRERFNAKTSMREYSRPPDQRDLLFNNAYYHVAGNYDCTSCDSKQTIERPERRLGNAAVKIHHGTIVSSKQVVEDARTRETMAEEYGDQVLCFEQGAVGLEIDFPCIVIRGISDYCDSHRNNEWREYASGNAAAYTRNLLLLIPSERVVKFIHHQRVEKVH